MSEVWKVEQHCSFSLATAGATWEHTLISTNVMITLQRAAERGGDILFKLCGSGECGMVLDVEIWSVLGDADATKILVGGYQGRVRRNGRVFSISARLAHVATLSPQFRVHITAHNRPEDSAENKQKQRGLRFFKREGETSTLPLDAEITFISNKRDEEPWTARVHKLLLAECSPFFKASFENGMRESVGSAVQVQCPSRSTAEWFMTLLYSHDNWGIYNDMPNMGVDASELIAGEVDALCQLHRFAMQYMAVALAKRCIVDLITRVMPSKVLAIAHECLLHAQPRDPSVDFLIRLCFEYARSTVLADIGALISDGIEAAEHERVVELLETMLDVSRETRREIKVQSRHSQKPSQTQQQHNEDA